MEWLEKVMERFARDRQVITHAPVTFLLAVVFVGLVIFWVISAHYGERIATLQEQVNLYRARGEQGKEVSSLRIAEEKKIAMAEELREAGSFSPGMARLPDSNSLYVADLLWVLKEAGWKVSSPVLEVWDKPMLGLFILVPDSGKRPTGAKILAQVFENHHIKFTTKPSQQQPPGTFALLFGSGM